MGSSPGGRPRAGARGAQGGGEEEAPAVQVEDIAGQTSRSTRPTRTRCGRCSTRRRSASCAAADELLDRRQHPRLRGDALQPVCDPATCSSTSAGPPRDAAPACLTWGTTIWPSLRSDYQSVGRLATAQSSRARWPTSPPDQAPAGPDGRRSTMASSSLSGVRRRSPGARQPGADAHLATILRQNGVKAASTPRQ